MFRLRDGRKHHHLVDPISISRSRTSRERPKRIRRAPPRQPRLDTQTVTARGLRIRLLSACREDRLSGRHCPFAHSRALDAGPTLPSLAGCRHLSSRRADFALPILSYRSRISSRKVALGPAFFPTPHIAFVPVSTLLGYGLRASYRVVSPASIKVELCPDPAHTAVLSYR